MANEKLLRANVRIDAYYPEAFADLANPTVAELNSAIMGFNISCAVEDSYTLNQTESDTDDSLTVCDIGNVETPTFLNYEATLPIFRDKDLAANGVFNLAFRLFKVEGIPFVLGLRIGTANDAAHVLNETVSLFGVVTDNPSDLVEDQSMIRMEAHFKPTGQINTNYKVVA